MRSPSLALKVAAVLFTLFCFAHVVRLFASVSIVVAERAVPVWFSIIAAVVAATMATWMWFVASPTKSSPPGPA